MQRLKSTLLALAIIILGKKVINFKMPSYLTFSNLENTLFVRYCQEGLTNKSGTRMCWE